LLAAALAGPVVAQEGGFHPPLNTEAVVPAQIQQPLPEAPMPRVKETNQFRVEVGSGVQTTIPLALGSAVPPVKAPDHRQLVNFSVGLFGNDGPVAPAAVELVPSTPPMTPPAKPGCCEPDCCPDCCRKPAVAVMPQPVPPCLPQAQQTVSGSFIFGGPCTIQPNGAQFLSFQQARDDAAFNLHAKPLPTCDHHGPMPPRRVVVLAEGLAERNVLEVRAPCPLPPVAANPLVGTWYRETHGTVVSATFTRDELKLCLTQSADGHTATVTVTGHYTLTKDGLVYGAVTGADVDVKTGSKTDDAALGMELAEMSLGLQTLVDAPFSFRVKHTSAGLMVSQVKCGMAMSGDESQMLVGGMFKPAKDGRAPVPVSVKPIPPTLTGTGPIPPCPPNVERAGIDVNFNAAPTMTPPPCPGVCESFAGSLVQFTGAGSLMRLAGTAYEWRSPPPAPCPLPPPVRPVGCGVPDGSTKSMVGEAFGQMLQEKSRCQPLAPGMTLPSPHYLQHYPQYVPPAPAFPLPRELPVACPPMPCPVQPIGGSFMPAADTPIHGSYAPTPMVPPTAPMPVKPGLVGTWYREIGPVMCVVKIAPDHVTVTAYAVAEVNGKPVKQGAVITADYHLTRDGSTMVGLITGLDMICEGDVADDGDVWRVTEELSRLQKTFVDHPFAFSVRVYGDALMIGNVKAPRLDNDPSSVGQMFAGRYKSAADKPVPQPKPIRSKERACTPSPSVPPAVGVTTPAPAPSGTTYRAPPAPQGDLLPPPASTAPQAVPAPPAPVYDPIPATPAPRVRVIEEDRASPMPRPMPPTRTMEEPVPTMPEPAKPGRNVRSLNQEGEGEVLHDEQWYRRPVHLTPERIRGGIY
jgi:hypothetical protein